MVYQMSMYYYEMNVNNLELIHQNVKDMNVEYVIYSIYVSVFPKMNHQKLFIKPNQFLPSFLITFSKIIIK
jgi:hypothetical protein